MKSFIFQAVERRRSSRKSSPCSSSPRLNWAPSPPSPTSPSPWSPRRPSWSPSSRSPSPRSSVWSPSSRRSSEVSTPPATAQADGARLAPLPVDGHRVDTTTPTVDTPPRARLTPATTKRMMYSWCNSRMRFFPLSLSFLLSLSLSVCPSVFDFDVEFYVWN